MIYETDDQPIVACSTGLSENTAIGIIRLSGFDNLKYLQKFFKKNLGSIEPRYATFVKLYDDTQNFLDEVVITYFEGPNSYNGENILEIAAHGNALNLRRIINAFVNSKLFRLAKQGEFTYRALKNKKLSLSQVEGLDTLLNASSSLALDEGLKILNGTLHKKYMSLYDSFLKLKASVEINIDFAEDVGEEQSRKLLDDGISEVRNNLEDLYRSATINTKSLMSSNIVLCGEPNAGKSSFFNSLLNESRSIVSDIAGTTRDYVSEYINLGNETFKLVDTAGLRRTTDQIESQGIERSLDLLENGFYKILLVNTNEVDNFSFDSIKNVKFDALLFTHFDQYDGSNINIKNLPEANKYYGCDNIAGRGVLLEYSGSIGATNQGGSIEPEYINGGSMGATNKDGPIEPDKLNGPTGAIEVGSIGPSLLTGPTGAELIELITQDILSKYLKLHNSDPITIERHRSLIVDLHKGFTDFSNNISMLDDIAIISSELSILEKKCSELIGIINSQDTLNHIFTNFCIGK